MNRVSNLAPDAPLPPDCTPVHPPAQVERPRVVVAVNGHGFVPERIEGLGVHFPKDLTQDVHISLRLVVKAGDAAEAVSILAGVGR